MRKSFIALAAMVLVLPLLAIAPAVAQTGGDTFWASLSGDEEVPAPVVTDGTGVASFMLSDDGSELHYSVFVNGVEDIVGAHIHSGAVGVNGPVLAGLFPTNPGVTVDGLLSQGVITDDDVLTGTVADLAADLAAGSAYVNVHSATYPAGHLRGQIGMLDVVDAFADDNGNFHEDNINQIAAAGITLGTGPGTFDPGGHVTRWQMATFMTRSFNLPMTTTDFFTDDDGQAFEPYVNAVANAGITLGCAAGQFCPFDYVTRAQMASFVARAWGFQVAPDADFFDDVGDTNVHGGNINTLAGLGISTGTSSTTYDPNGNVRRDQMASFLGRTMGLAERAATVYSLVILHNNDGESELVADGDIGGAARFKSVVDQQKALAASQSDGVLMLSSGDNFLAGTAFEASLQDGIFYDVLTLDAIGYDALQLGNHDFDFGPDVLTDFINAYPVAPPYLGANLDFSGEPGLQALVTAGTIAPSTTVDVNGSTIGIVGAVTPNLPFISSPRNVVVDPDIAGTVQAEIDLMEAAGVDKIILISHLQGLDEDVALGPDLSGLDVMIAGGGDELLANDASELLPSDDVSDIFGPYPSEAMNAEGAAVPVVTTSGQYGYLGRLVVWFDADGNVVDAGGGPIPINGQSQDATLLTTVEEPVALFQANLALNVIATSEVALDGVRENVRSIETNEGNLLADSQLWQANELAASFGVGDADVAIQNGGGIRNDDVRGPGDITELDTFDMLPFGNLVTIVEDIPRDQFKEILENMVSSLNGDGTLGGSGTGRFGQIAGFTFTWDGAGTAQVLDDDANVVTPGTRITEVMLDDATVIVTGGAVVAGDPVNIAIANFLATGGDQYPFRGAAFTSLGVTGQQAAAAYIQALAADGGLESTITAVDYPEGGEGRITHIPG